MILSLPDEIILNIIKHLDKTKYHLIMRRLCRKMYSIYDKVPFYIDKKYIGNIYITPELMVWRSHCEQKRLLKEIIFGSYGRININIYNSKFFSSKDRIYYDLPNTIKKTTYEKNNLTINNINIKNNIIETKIIPTRTPPCIIS